MTSIENISFQAVKGQQYGYDLTINSVTFSPETFDSLLQGEISVAESCGNCKIVASPLFINISGQKCMQTKETRGKAFNEAGLKLTN